MAQNNILTTVLILFLGSLQFGKNVSCLRLEINPAQYDGVTSKTVQISCAPDRTDGAVKKVVVIEIFEKGSSLIASVSENGNLTLSDETDQRFQIDGQITKNTTDAFLRLTLLNPKSQDSGFYTCILYYKDDTSFLKIDKATKLLTVTEIAYRRLKRVISDLEVQLKKDEAENRRNISILEEKTQIQERRLKNLKNKVSFVTAFSATVSRPIPFSPGKTVVFSSILMQKGQGYDKDTGVFTSPIPGIYLFYVVMGNAADQNIMTFDIKVNEKTVAAMQIAKKLLDNWRDQNSMSSLVNLKAGDKVKVVMGVGGGSVRAEKISIFGGHCVSQTFPNDINA